MPPACFVKLVAACSGPCSGPQPEKRLGVTKNGIATVGTDNHRRQEF